MMARCHQTQAAAGTELVVAAAWVPAGRVQGVVVVPGVEVVEVAVIHVPVLDPSGHQKRVLL